MLEPKKWHIPIEPKLIFSPSYLHGYANRDSEQTTLTYFGRGSTTVQLTSLIGLDWGEQVNLLLIKHKQSSWIQSSQTGGRTNSDTSPYE